MNEKCINCGHDRDKHVAYGIQNREHYCIADKDEYPSNACGCNEFKLKEAKKK